MTARSPRYASALLTLCALATLAGCSEAGGSATTSAAALPATSAPGGVAVTAPPAPAGTLPTVAATALQPAPSSHRQVIAQGLVDFAAGEHHWELATGAVTSATSAIGVADPVFVVSQAADGLLLGPSGQPPAWRLGAGEAVLHRGGGALDAAALGAAGGSLTTIAPVAGPGPHAFTPGEGPRDLELIGDVLAPNEVLALHGYVASFVLVTRGSVDAGGTAIVADAPVALTGDVTLTNVGAEPASVLVAVVGAAATEPAAAPATVLATVPPSSTPDGDTPAPRPTTTAPRATTTTSPTTTSTTTTSTTTTTTEPEVDTDSDGLADSREAALGTDPNDQDSDNDGIPDGREVDALGSNPLDTDTDSDGLTDALEVDRSCDINVPDTDGDGLGDAFEANSGFSECSLADTDGDGDSDLTEFSLGTDPRDPNDPPF